MRNFKMTLQYEGTKYQGWQKQTSTDNTIQGKLEHILSVLFETKIEIQGAGRTDAGVHAREQIANFHAETEKPIESIMRYVNRYLPEDIAVIKIEEVPERFHSRLNAKGKIYQYRILNSDIPNVFDRRYTFMYPDALDVSKMKEAAAMFVGTHDFRAFTSNKRSKKSAVRTIEDIKVETKEAEIIFTFSGNGFLYHMVRILMGTLVEVGNGQREISSIKSLLEEGGRMDAGFLVPAMGLTLLKVKYKE